MDEEPTNNYVADEWQLDYHSPHGYLPPTEWPLLIVRLHGDGEEEEEEEEDYDDDNDDDDDDGEEEKEKGLIFSF